MKTNHTNAIIVLHEIYGINPFIQTVCDQLKTSFDVFCPNLLQRKSFAYDEADVAYRYFQENVGFDAEPIISMIHALKETHHKVFVLGFSVGATIAWKCSADSHCDGVIGFYGSRIRDYTDINPQCQTLLLFATYDSFDVDTVLSQLTDKPNVECVTFAAAHGFMDFYSSKYNKEAATHAIEMVRSRLKVGLMAGL